MLKKSRFLLPTCLAFGALIAPLNDLHSSDSANEQTSISNSQPKIQENTSQIEISDVSVREIANSKLSEDWVISTATNLGTNIIESRTIPLCNIKCHSSHEEIKISRPVVFDYRIQNRIGRMLASNEQITFSDVAQAILDMYESISPKIVLAIGNIIEEDHKIVQSILDQIGEVPSQPTQDVADKMRVEPASFESKYAEHIEKLIFGLIIMHQYNQQETEIAAKMVIRNVNSIIDIIKNNKESFADLYAKKLYSIVSDCKHCLTLHPDQNHKDIYSVRYKVFDTAPSAQNIHLNLSLLAFARALVDISGISSEEFDLILNDRTKAEINLLSSQEMYSVKILKSNGYKNIKDWDKPDSSNLKHETSPITLSGNQIERISRQSDNGDVFEIYIADILNECSSRQDSCGINVSDEAQKIVSFFVYNFPAATNRIFLDEELLEKNDDTMAGMWLHRAIELANKKSSNHNSSECDVENYLIALDRINSLSPDHKNFREDEVKRELEQIKELISQFTALDDCEYSGKFPLLKITRTFLDDDGSTQNCELISIVEINGKVVNRNNLDRQLLLVGAFVDLTDFILERALNRLGKSTEEKSGC